MKKFLFLSALAIMGFACVGCTTNDNNSTTTPGIESTVPNNGTNGTTNGTGNGNLNGTTNNATNGTTNGATNGTTNTTNGMNDGALNNTDNATNGVVTDQNGIINEGDQATVK